MALPDYLQETAKDYAKQLTAATSAPIDTSKFTGRQVVAGEDPLQTQAINLATQGIGGFQPFLTSAQQAITQAGQDVGAVRQDLAGLGQFMGTGAGTGPRSDKWPPGHRPPPRTASGSRCARQGGGSGSRGR